MVAALERTGAAKTRNGGGGREDREERDGVDGELSKHVDDEWLNE